MAARPKRRAAAPPAPPPAPRPEPAELSAGTRRAFWVATLLVPVLFFALLEGGLRLGGYGGHPPLFVPLDEGGQYLTPNREVARRYFAGSFVPNPNPDWFHAEKPANALRIVVQGESSTAGYPYYRGASFPQVLGAMLRAADPGREVEVVNTAMAAVNSYTLLDLADEIVDVRPDAVLIYTGHNEFYGALGAASSESVGRSPAVVRAYLRLRQLRTVQLARGALARVQRAAGASRDVADGRPTNTLMAQMVGEQSVPVGSATYRAGLRQFEDNLGRLLARYAAAGIPVYVGTLASNERDQRPFVVATQNGDADARAEALRAALAQVQAGQAEAGLAALRRLDAADSLAADAPFALGRALLAQGDSGAALAALQRARDRDALRFRAPTDFNAVLRRLAAQHGAVVVDVEAQLRAASPQGVIGRSLMLEHLHPNVDGYALAAQAFFDAMRARGQAGRGAVGPARQYVLLTQVDSVAAALRMDRLTRAWPFRPDEVTPAVLDRVPGHVVEQAEAILGGADWLTTVGTLGRWYEERGMIRESRTAREAVVAAFPFLPAGYVEWANLEMQQATTFGRADRLPVAERLYARALAIAPGNAEPAMMLGAIRLQAGDTEAAVRYLEQAARVPQPPPQALYNLAGAYARLGRWADAEATAMRLARMQPGNAQYQAFAEAVRRRTLGV